MGADRPAEPRAAAPWIWGRAVDLAVFGAAPLLSVALAALEPALAPGGAVPLWAFVAFVVLVDVAHVHTTLFRTYLDGAELRRRPLLYAALPAAIWAAGALLHGLGGARLFWRVLAYVAVAHFVRQQVGWVAIYRARAGERDRLGRVLDDATVYAATGYPLLHWHANLPQPFRWFVEGDFVDLSALAAAVPWARAAWAALLLAYAARAVLRPGAAPGKHVVVLGTALVWWFGIVGRPSDWSFTVTNVVAHGVPYFALLFAYARERGAERPGSLVARVAAAGFAAFAAICAAIALGEELLWDRLVWHDRPELFGGERAAPLLGELGLALVVPLLAVPQATHYVLDALLWRRGETGPAQARALGFRPRLEPVPELR